MSTVDNRDVWVVGYLGGGLSSSFFHKDTLTSFLNYIIIIKHLISYSLHPQRSFRVILIHLLFEKTCGETGNYGYPAPYIIIIFSFFFSLF